MRARLQRAGRGRSARAAKEALLLAETAEGLEKRIRVEGVKTGRVTALDLPGQVREALALGIVSAAEAQILDDYDAKVMAMIGVDDFAPHEIGTQGAAAGTPA